jgi:hypothetical protein
MAYSEIAATMSALQHTQHFHQEKMSYYQRLFNQRFRGVGNRLMDTEAEQFYQRLFNIHFQAFAEIGVILEEYADLANTLLLKREAGEKGESAETRG